MQVLEHERDLSGVELRLLIVKVADRSQVVEQLTSGNKVQVQDQILVILGDAVHLDLPSGDNYQKWMIDLSQNVDLGNDVINLLELDDLTLLENLHCVVLLVLLVESQTDSTK